MHEWYSACREFCANYENPRETRNAILEIFRELSRTKIKDKGKFKNRDGPEYRKFVDSLKSKPELVQDILQDDEFFKMTLEKTRN
jgi:hypothetical protein